MSHKRFQSDKLTTLLVDIDSMTEYNELNAELKVSLNVKISREELPQWERRILKF